MIFLVVVNNVTYTVTQSLASAFFRSIAGRSTSLGEYPGSRQSAAVGRMRQSDGGAGQYPMPPAGVIPGKSSKDGSMRLPGGAGTPVPKAPDGVLPEVPLDSAVGHSPLPATNKSGLLSSVDAPSSSIELSKLSGAQTNVAVLRRSVSPGRVFIFSKNPIFIFVDT